MSIKLGLIEMSMITGLTRVDETKINIMVYHRSIITLPIGLGLRVIITSIKGNES